MNKHQLIEQLDRVTYLAGDGNYTNVYFVDSAKQLFATTLGDFARDFPEFIRIHKSYLINPAHIADYRSDSVKGAAIRIGDQWLPISRRKINDIKPLIKPKVLTGGVWYQIQKPHG
ncbi:LytTR family transcriptional regulator DNA-binding domain-containing protein [Spirosoma soli]|uniref:LytTR family transcriptional regulator DNA-binding domain-containing protein n=1 Tax=Spirosoma soli TaxID=1770529 RepID=A0ABW5M5L3_9BACT